MRLDFTAPPSTPDYTTGNIKVEKTSPTSRHSPTPDKAKRKSCRLSLLSIRSNRAKSGNCESKNISIAPTTSCKSRYYSQLRGYIDQTESTSVLVATKMNGHSDDGGAPESPAVEADAEETIVEPVIKGGAPDEIDDEYTGRRNRKRPCQRFPIVEVSPSKKKTKQEINETRANCRVADDMSWICMECKEAEVLDDAVELIVCEGKCYRPFHTACVGLLNTPEDAWSCSDCKAERHVCSICQEFGIDDVDVFLCKQKACGLFFHESCLTSNNVDIKQVEKTTGGENGIDVPETRPEFKCPAHQCWTCTEEIVIKDEEEKVAKKGKAKKKRGKKQDNAFAVKNGQLFVSFLVSYHQRRCFTFSLFLSKSDASSVVLPITYPAFRRLLNFMSWHSCVMITHQSASSPTWIWKVPIKGN
jgi:hypothetical protein